MNLGEKLQYIYSTLFFDNLFTSPMLVTKLREKKRIYGTGIVQTDRKKHDQNENRWLSVVKQYSSNEVW